MKGNGATVVDKANQFTLGYNYNLSKRTKVYGFYTQVNNKGDAVTGGDYYVSTPARSSLRSPSACATTSDPGSSQRLEGPVARPAFFWS